MITATEFIKQIAKPFGVEMRKQGFKGSGLEYQRDDGDYLTAVYIVPSRWGGKCTAGFAIHPKAITKNYKGRLNLNKLKIRDFEFKMTLTDYAMGEWWNYSDDEFNNLATLNDIIITIKRKAFPVIEQFVDQPNILETFEIAEMADFHENWLKKTGVFLATVDSQFAWAMTLIHESRNLAKAKQFANWLLSYNKDCGWYTEDLKRVVTTNNSS